MVRYEVFSGKTAEKQPEMSIVKRVEGRGICLDSLAVCPMKNNFHA